ncbi:MAG: sugar phosphate isomerase/epimerase family protein [Ktedonobacteraceae bacterium]
MFKLGIEILPYHDFPLEEALGEIARLGFSEVNLWSSRSPLAHHVNPGDDPQAIRALLQRYGMHPTALTMYGKTQEEMKQRIEFAAELGIDTVIFDCEANFPDFVSSFLPPLLDVAAKNGVRIAVENHLTVPFTEDFETGGHEVERWGEGVDSLAQIKRLVTELDVPHLGVCLAPPHLWVMDETISEAIFYLAERKKLFFYYIWDIDRQYRRGIDGLNFGPGEQQLPREDGTLDHRVLLRTLKQVGYEGVASLKCHGTAGWPLQKVTNELARSAQYVRRCMADL